MSNFQHVVINRAELAKILMEAKGMDPDKVTLVNLDILSTQHQAQVPLYRGEWTDSACLFDLVSFGVKPNDEDPLSTQPS